MKTATVTITGKLGPGKTATALVFTDVTSINFQVKNNTIDIVQDAKAQKHTVFDYNDTATVTYTITGNDAAITIST